MVTERVHRLNENHLESAQKWLNDNLVALMIQIDDGDCSKVDQFKIKKVLDLIEQRYS